jgi:VanZ family protein
MDRPSEQSKKRSGVWFAEWRASRSARAIFWTAAGFAFVMAILPHPPEVPGHPSDKVQHIAAFATLSLLGGFAYPRTDLMKLLIRLSLFGAAIEVVQAIPALHRDSDVLDWLADTVAVAVVLLIVRRWRGARA